MKKSILLLIAYFTILHLNAQSSKREEGIQFGLKAGLNASNFSGDLKDNKMRNGLHIGLVTEIIISDKFSLQPELLYSAQGYKDETPDAFSKQKFDYLNVPVLVKYYVANNLSIEGGPQVGYLLNAITRDNDGNTSIPEQSKVDFGVDLGLSYELTSGVFFQGRYNLGITNVNAASNASAFTYANSVFQLSVGCFF